MSEILINGKPLEIECDPGKVSDGYHTFDELYEHRCLLFCMLCHFIEGRLVMGFDLECWRSRLHSDGSGFDGWFIAGMKGACLKPVTYHLPDRLWHLLDGVSELERAPEWDGHSSQDVIERLTVWLKEGVD